MNNKNAKFYLCKHCGNFVGMIRNTGVPIICCGEPMQELVPNSTEAATEKHLPVIAVDGNTVTVTVSSVEPVSYTHLDVYKRQAEEKENLNKDQILGGTLVPPFLFSF